MDRADPNDRFRWWRSLSLAEREREYSPSSCVGGDIDPYLAQYVDRSAAAREAVVSVGCELIELRYGAGEAQTIDLVTPRDPEHPSPLVVYLHGGYWQQLSKLESFFCAADCIDHGISFAAVDYTLAPQATLDEIVAECRDALNALRAVANEHDINADRIIVAGSSAGGHLAAMMALGLYDGWRPAAVGLISGVFELEPLIGTYINDAVQLDLDGARRNSPMFKDLGDFPPSLIAFGDNETDQFKRQSHDMASLLTAAGRPTDLVEIDERNHFDVVLDLCDRDTELGRRFLALVEATA